MEAPLGKRSPFAKTPIAPRRATLASLADSLAVAYAAGMEAAEGSAAPARSRPVFEPTRPVPEELREAVSAFFSDGLDRYADLLIVLGDEQYVAVDPRSMIGVGSVSRRREPLILAPVISVVRAYMAEGERGLATAIAMAGVFVGRFAARLGAAIGLHLELNAPPTLLAPAYLWRR